MLEQAKGLTIAFRVAHAEVMGEAFFHAAAFLRAQEHYRAARQFDNAAEAGAVVFSGAVAAHFNPDVGRQPARQLQKVRPLRMPRDLQAIDRREIAIEPHFDFLGLMAQPLDFIRKIDAHLLAAGEKFSDFIFDRHQRALKFQGLQGRRRGHITQGLS